MQCGYSAILLSRPGETGLLQMLGALWAAEDNGMLSEVIAWVCPANTALIAIMLICGYKCVEIMAILNGIPELVLSTLPFINSNSENSIDDLKAKFREIIFNKIGKILTLHQLRETYGNTIVTLGFTLETQHVEYINADTYPNMNLVDFLCISFSVPGIYKSYKYDNKNWLDASIIEPYPIQSIELEDGKILGLINAQLPIVITSMNPLTRFKNIMRLTYEASRINNIPILPNLTTLILPVDNVSIYEHYDITNPFEKILALKVSDEVLGKLRCGWVEFMKSHFEHIRQIDTDDAENQE